MSTNITRGRSFLSAGLQWTEEWPDEHPDEIEICADLRDRDVTITLAPRANTGYNVVARTMNRAEVEAMCRNDEPTWRMIEYAAAAPTLDSACALGVALAADVERVYKFALELAAGRAR